MSLFTLYKADFTTKRQLAFFVVFVTMPLQDYPECPQNLIIIVIRDPSDKPMSLPAALQMAGNELNY